MAKKNVNIVEQHVEKVVLGIAVLFLLAVIFMYLVGSPNSVDFEGKSFGPSQIDLEVRQKAERLAGPSKLGRTTPMASDEIPVPNWAERLNASFVEGVVKSNALASTLTPTVPFGLPVPKLKIEKTRQVYEGFALVKVLAPEKPKVRFERLLGLTAQQTDKSAAGARGKPAEGEEQEAQDIDMVVVETQFDAESQLGLIRKAYRDEEFQGLIFAEVQVERRMVFGDDAGEWETVETFSLRPPPTRPTLKLVGEVPAPDSREAFDQYRKGLIGDKGQLDVLLPEGPIRQDVALVGGRAAAPEAPTERRSRPTDRGGALARTLARGGYGETPRESRSIDPSRTPRAERPIRLENMDQAEKYYSETLKKAEAALKERKTAEAEELAKKVIEVSNANPRTASREDIDRANKILATVGRSERGGTPVPAVQEERFRQIRAMDINGEPGRTYQYRVRVGILNELCMAPARLKDPNDATIPVVFGDWSEPSEPVTIQQDIFFFLAGEWPAGQNLPAAVRVEVFKWYLGQWVKASFRVEPGDEIGGKSNVAAYDPSSKNWYREELDFATGAVAVDYALKVPYQQLLARDKGFEFTPQPLPTARLVYLDTDDELQERFASVDSSDTWYRELNEKVKANQPDKGVKEREKKTSKAEPTKGSKGRGSIGRTGRSGGMTRSRGSRTGRSGR